MSRTCAEAEACLGQLSCPRCGQAETGWEYTARLYGDSFTGNAVLD